MGDTKPKQSGPSCRLCNSRTKATLLRSLKDDMRKFMIMSTPKTVLDRSSRPFDFLNSLQRGELIRICPACNVAMSTSRKQDPRGPRTLRKEARAVSPPGLSTKPEQVKKAISFNSAQKENNPEPHGKFRRKVDMRVDMVNVSCSVTECVFLRKVETLRRDCV